MFINLQGTHFRLSEIHTVCPLGFNTTTKKHTFYVHGGSIALDQGEGFFSIERVMVFSSKWEARTCREYLIELLNYEGDWNNRPRPTRLVKELLESIPASSQC